MGSANLPVLLIMVFQGDKILYPSKTSGLNESLDHFLFYNSDNFFYIMNINKNNQKEINNGLVKS